MTAFADALPRRSRRPLFGILVAALLGGGLLPAMTRAESAVEPYRRLRETTAGYYGPAEDFTHLTEVRIGWFGPSDPADSLNGDFWWAADLAVREANEQRTGTDPAAFTALPIRLVPRWAPDPWRAGVSLLARMVYDEQPLALLGSIDSASTHLAEQVVAKANLPLVSPLATDKTATLAGVSWMFSCAPDDAAIARVLVDDVLAALSGGERPEVGSPTKEVSDQPQPVGRRPSAIEKRKAKIVLLATTDHESRMTAREVTCELSRHGLLPEFRFDLSPGVANADESLQGASAALPAAVIVIADASDSARLTRAVRERLGTVPVFGGQTMGRARFLELAGPAAEGVRFPLLFVPGARDEIASRFATRFAAERHHAPDYAAALAYDATRLLIAAIHRAGPNRARIREAITQLSPWPGIAGPIRFDGTGQNQRADLSLGTIRKGTVAQITGPTPSTSNSNRHEP